MENPRCDERCHETKSPFVLFPQTKKCSLPHQPWRWPYHILIPTSGKVYMILLGRLTMYFITCNNKSWFKKYTYLYIIPPKQRDIQKGKNKMFKNRKNIYAYTYAISFILNFLTSCILFFFSIKVFPCSIWNWCSRENHIFGNTWGSRVCYFHYSEQTQRGLFLYAFTLCWYLNIIFHIIFLMWSQGI